MDCILGPHCSQRPLATRTTESAVRSRSAKMRVSSRLMPGALRWSARSMSRTPVYEGLRHMFEQPCHQVRVGVYDDDGGLGSLPSAFSLILCVTRWCMRVDLPMRVLAT